MHIVISPCTRILQFKDSSCRYVYVVSYPCLWSVSILHSFLNTPYIQIVILIQVIFLLNQVVMTVFTIWFSIKIATELANNSLAWFRCQLYFTSDFGHRSTLCSTSIYVVYVKLNYHELKLQFQNKNQIKSVNWFKYNPLFL